MSSLFEKYTVLYAEDNDESRKNYASFLKTYFKDVYEAEDGEQALELYYKHKPDILILDINMPKEDGLSLSRKVRQNDKITKIILLTAYLDQEKLLLATDLYLTKYLHKPVKREEFVDVVRKALYEIEKERSSAGKVFLKDDFIWDTVARRLVCRGKEVRLTKNEATLLECLASQQGNVVTVQDITYTFWDFGREKDLTVDGLKGIIKRLRKKLPKESIENIFGVGYRLT
jgi:DNA-binding response OmpR family regulator